MLRTVLVLVALNCRQKPFVAEVDNALRVVVAAVVKFVVLFTVSDPATVVVIEDLPIVMAEAVVVPMLRVPEAPTSILQLAGILTLPPNVVFAAVLPIVILVAVVVPMFNAPAAAVS